MINKDKNINLQITLTKATYNKLLEIQEDVSALLDVDLNKSQTISFLIKNYSHIDHLKTSLNTSQTAPKNNKSAVNYQAQVKALKDKLDVSYNRLSELLGIPAPTLKKYASGIQQPKGENEILLNKAIKDYGIK